MKRVTLAAAALGVAAAGAGAALRPAEFEGVSERATAAARQAWDGVAANPAPAGIALGTFLLTVVYHTARGKTLRESVEVAATRVTVVPVPQPAAAADEPAVVRRAKARATRTQLIADQIGLENRRRHLPEAIVAAEKDVCHRLKAVTEAEAALRERRKWLAEAEGKLKGLRAEQADGEAEAAAIAAELAKLADAV
jgi:hypothetical protein